MDVESSFGLHIEFTEREDSPTGRTTTSTIRVDGQSATYEGPFGEQRGGEFDTERVEFELTGEQLRILQEELENFDMHQSVTASFDVESIDADTTEYAVRRDIDVTATIVADGTEHEMNLTGVTSIDGHRTDKECTDQLRGLRHLCGRFKEWAEESQREPSPPWWHPKAWLL